MNKNNVLINLSTNIINDDINIEKLKIHQKLVEYRKLIDAKINKLMNDKQTNQKKKVINYLQILQVIRFFQIQKILVC